MIFEQNLLSEISFKLPENINSITEEKIQQFNQKTAEIKTNFSDLTQQTLENLSLYKQELNNITNQTTESFTKNITETTNNITNQIISVTEKSQNSLNETMEKAQTLTNDLNEKITLSLDGIFVSWVQEHPFFYWFISHPIFAFIFILFSLLFIFSLGQVFLEIIKQFLVTLLRTPWLISKFVFLKSVNQPLINDSLISQNNTQILQKLEAIERNQKAILEELSKFNQN